MACPRALQDRVLEVAQGIGGAFTRDALWDRFTDTHASVLERRQLSECLRGLERRGKVFANDGHGTLARWGGIRRARYWSSRGTLERAYGYGAAELGLERD